MKTASQCPSSQPCSKTPWYLAFLFFNYANLFLCPGLLMLVCHFLSFLSVLFVHLIPFSLLYPPPRFSLSVFQPNSWGFCNTLTTLFAFSKIQGCCCLLSLIYFASNFRLLWNQVETGQFISVWMSEVLKLFVYRVLSHLWIMLPVNWLCFCINEAYSSPGFVCLDFKLTAAAL